jgi:Domain of unknown function (DUF1707)/Cell wall-active antibiotics response 4TMS YvqF
MYRVSDRPGDGATMNLSSPIEPARQRASDADRELVATALGEAFASGRLNATEHAERLDAAFAARTIGELEPLTRDLPPALTSSGPPAPSRSAATFSKLRHSGPMALPRHSEAAAVFGALVLDLRQATFPEREITITADSYFGKIELIVPDDAQVYESGTALFGKRTMLAGAPSAPDGPVIHVRGRSMFGHIRVTRGHNVWHWEQWREQWERWRAERRLDGRHGSSGSS